MAARRAPPTDAATPDAPTTGVREALGEAFAREIWDSWQEHGKEALDKVRTDKPDLYVKLVTAMLPKEPEMKASAPDDLDDAALDRRIAELSADLGLAIGARRGAGNKAKAARPQPVGRISSVHEAD